jgi:hypothetical protein
MIKWCLIIVFGSRTMVHKPVLFVLLLAVIGAGLTNVAAADAAPPEVIKILRRDEVVDAAGNQTTALHVEKLATNESAAHNIAQYTLEFSESIETAEILEAFTRKADGTKSTERRSSRRRRPARRRYRNLPTANRRSWSFRT